MGQKELWERKKRCFVLHFNLVKHIRVSCTHLSQNLTKNRMYKKK